MFIEVDVFREDLVLSIMSWCSGLTRIRGAVMALYIGSVGPVQLSMRAM